MYWLWFVCVLTLVLCVPSWSQQNTLPGTSEASWPPFWVMLEDRPDDLLSVMMQTPEPYTPPMLDALQNALPKFTDSSPYPGFPVGNSSAVAAAQILYRYHRRAGYDYLVKDFTHKPNVTEAAVFAQRQVMPMRDAILLLLPGNLHEGQLIDALGEWHDPVVADTLWNAFQKDSGNSVLALALAQQDAHQAAPLIRHIYFSARSDQTDQQEDKIDAAAALVKLDGSKASLMLKYLLGILASGPQVSDISDRYELRQQAARVLGEMNIKAAVPTLRSLVRHYLDSKHSHGSQMDTDEGYEVVLVGYAVQSLAQIHDTSSKELVSELLAYLKKNDTGASDDFAEAALDLGISEATVRKYIHSDDDMTHIQSLRYQEKTQRPTNL